MPPKRSRESEAESEAELETSKKPKLDTAEQLRQYFRRVGAETERRAAEAAALPAENCKGASCAISGGSTRRGRKSKSRRSKSKKGQKIQETPQIQEKIIS